MIKNVEGKNMKRIILLLAVLFLVSLSALAESADSIVKKIDYNQSPDSVIYNAKMVISKNGKNTEKEMKIYGKGKKSTFVEFLAPARDKGTKYLRIDSNLWMYLAEAEKTMKISGHMLRQGMMGSDFSYEDQTERTKLFEDYNYSIIGEESINGRKKWVMMLVAKPNIELTYVKRKIWVDMEQYIVSRSELYAKSGKLIKEYSTEEVKKIGDRYYPTVQKMTDKIKSNSFTTITFTNINLDNTISDSVFTMQNLEKKN